MGVITVISLVLFFHFIQGVAPMATDISARSKIDMQLQELNEKIEQTSKYVEERKKAEDLSSLTTEELHTKVQELKHRKELLSKFRQKAQVISLIQDLHTQVSAMKENVKTIEDKSKYLLFRFSFS